MPPPDAIRSRSISSVEDTLKSSRSVHLVLVGASAAVALFAASPREVEKYLDAKKDLIVLRQADFKDFVRHERLLVESEALNLEWLGPDMLFPSGRIIASLSPFDLFAVTYDADPSDGTIDQLLRFIDTEHPVKMLVPEETDPVFQNFLKALATFASENPQSELESLSFKPDPDNTAPSALSAYAVYRRSDGGPAPVLSVSVSLREVFVTEDAFASWVGAFLLIDWDRLPKQFKLQPDSTPSLSKPPVIFLRERPVKGASPSPEQVREEGSPSLEHVRKIENEISGMKLTEAARYLETKIASAIGRSMCSERRSMNRSRSSVVPLRFFCRCFTCCCSAGGLRACRFASLRPCKITLSSRFSRVGRATLFAWCLQYGR